MDMPLSYIQRAFAWRHSHRTAVQGGLIGIEHDNN
jgi:hypothetical protein